MGQDQTEKKLLSLFVNDPSGCTTVPVAPNADRRVHQYYLPVYQWILKCLEKSRGHGPFILGVNGPQGAGKTTMAQTLLGLFKEANLKAAAISIDDFYLTRTEQVALSARFKNNPYLQQRGYPGTHDVDLGENILMGLKSGTAGGGTLCPVYDKSAFDGNGDRAPKNKWKLLEDHLDLILFEGWMLGFTKIENTIQMDSSMKEVNGFLPNYQKWTQHLNGFIHLEAERTEFIVDWRVEAEEKMKAQGKTGMTLEQIKNYIHKFLPAYQLYVPQLRLHPPTKQNYLHMVLGRDRLPVSDG